MDSGEVERGRGMAIFSHASVVFGVPVFLLVLIKRDNGFAVCHARAAACIFALCAAMLFLSWWSCAFFLPLALVCYIPAVIGVYRAACGLPPGPGALGTVGDKLLGKVEVRE